MVHNNLNLPLVVKNFETKACSVLGISTIANSNGESIEEDIDNKEYINPSLIEKFDRRWDEEVKFGRLVRRDEFRRVMSLKEFCDRYEGNWAKDTETNEKVLYLIARREVFNDIHHPVRLVPHLEIARANPKSAKHWLYCKHLCLWLIPCKCISDIMPESALEGKELGDYWIDKFDCELRKRGILPKWVRRQCFKYEKGESSSDDEGEEIQNGVGSITKVFKETEVGSSDESDKDNDGDPRAKRVENAFYQNIDEQIHLRCESEADLDENDDFSNIINMSNPRGANFMKFAENEVLPSYQQIMSRLNSLKDKPPVADQFMEISLNEKQSLFQDIVVNYVYDGLLA